MKKTIGLFLCGISCLVSSAYAGSKNEHQFSLGPSIEIELPPNEPQYFINSFMWTIKANCTLMSEAPVIQLTFTVLRKSGTIDNTTVNNGDSMSMTFAPNDHVELSAISGGKVELVNTGEETVTASCYTL
jgi:hypothetical protein